MNAIFELVWRQWDRKCAELERMAGAPSERPAPAKDDGVEVRYLNDIVRQNIGEMKDLKLKIAALTVENEKLGRKLSELAAKSADRRSRGAAGRARTLAVIRRMRKASALLAGEKALAEALRKENEFLKCETQINPERVRELFERSGLYEKKLRLKEEEISRLYAKLQVCEQEKRALSDELDKSRAENTMLRVRKVFGAREKRRKLNGWLSKPIFDVKF